jgi:hypothetical protein
MQGFLKRYGNSITQLKDEQNDCPVGIHSSKSFHHLVAFAETSMALFSGSYSGFRMV